MPFPLITPALDRALADHGYLEPTPVQSAVLETEADERDLLVSAQTGSGKTVAYGLAFAPTLLGAAERFSQVGNPLALIIAPTRELALQVERELSWLYAHAGARVVTCVGGMDPRKEQRQLASGCHIVVGTPGRLRDHVERGNLTTSDLKVVVLDEADEMLDLGFREDLEAILDETPAERRTLMFSATIAKEIAGLARRYQRDALRIDTTVKNEPHGDIEYRAVRVAPNDVEHAIVNVLRFYEAGGALVFCSTRESVRRFQAALQERGFAVVALSGELSQTERLHALQSLRDGRARVCVATDVAARGLDLPDLGLVIHAELPLNKQALLHRSGRTGRAGRKGVSVLIVPHNRRRKAEMLLDSASIDAAWGAAPRADEIRARDQDRLLNDPILTEEITEEDRTLAQLLLSGRTAEDIAAALIRLHRSRLPSPEELFDDGPATQVREHRPLRDGEGERGHHLGDADVSWFQMNVGRRQNADPKWLVPLICRLGHITKRDIGLIRIFDRDTRFGISQEAAAKFTLAVKATAEEDIRIEPSSAPGPAEGRPPRSERPPRKDVAPKPREDRSARPQRVERFTPRPDAAPAERPPRQDKPFKNAFASKPHEGAPRADKPYTPALDAAPAGAPPRKDKPFKSKPFAGKAKGPEGATPKGWASKKPPGAGKKKKRKGNDS